MKIACIDKAAAHRVKLQATIDGAYELCRNSVGYVTLAQTYPASKDEVLLGSKPDVAAVGAGFSIEESYATCAALKERHPSLTVITFLTREYYSLRTLRRFEKVATEVFTTDEDPVRIVHKLSSLAVSNHRRHSGQLIVLNGVKGGVGTTSIAAALAHAAEAVGKNAIVFDLSRSSCLAQYMGAERWHSPDYAAALFDNIVPDRPFVERCITRAPNGVTILLPPTGGTELRELWLRNPERFELTLTIIDHLREMYDLIIVDTASAEGVLPFALNSRAYARLLITSNEPASVHLLNSRLSEIAEIPGEGSIHILVNLSVDKGLTKDDVLDFLSTNEHFSKQMAVLEPLPFDSHARSWIGTGNTFYTECLSSVQQMFDDTLETLFLSGTELETKASNSYGLFSGLLKLAKPGRPRHNNYFLPPPKSLPAGTGKTDSNVFLMPYSNVISPPTPASDIAESASEEAEALFYGAPQLATGEK